MLLPVIHDMQSYHLSYEGTINKTDSPQVYIPQQISDSLQSLTLNDYFTALIYLKNTEYWPLQTVLRQILATLTISGSDYAEALAEKLGIDPATFAATMETWNKAVADQKDDAFGRLSFASALDTAPYYAIKVSPGIHHTMGGVKINTNAEVLTAEDQVIPGLYAAGEVTGGVHGANRLGGNAVADIVIFGRIAAQNAAAYIAK